MSHDGDGPPVNPDGTTRRRADDDDADAKTEALTPAQRARLMAQAEAHYRSGSGAGASLVSAGSQSAIRVNSERHKVAPLDPATKTASGVHAPAPPKPDRPDATVALDKGGLGQRGPPSLPSGETDTFSRQEAGFEPAEDEGLPNLEPTIPPAPGGDPAAFEADATVNYDPRLGDPDLTADDVARPHASDTMPSEDETTSPPEKPQPAWLASGRPVDLQRPPGGAPSEFGDLASGESPASPPAGTGATGPGPGFDADDHLPKTALVDMEQELSDEGPARRRWPLALGCLILTIGLAGGATALALGLVGEELTGGALDDIAALTGVDLRAATGEAEPDATPGGEAGEGPASPAEGEPDQAPASEAGPPALPDGVEPVPVRFQLVDDVSTSGYERMSAALKDAVLAQMTTRSALRPLEEGETERFALNLWLNKLRVAPDGDAVAATAACTSSATSAAPEARPLSGKARKVVREPAPTPPADADEEDKLAARRVHEAALARRVVEACGAALADRLIEATDAPLLYDKTGEAAAAGAAAAAAAAASRTPDGKANDGKEALTEDEPRKVKRSKKKRRRRHRRKRSRRKRRR